MEIIGGYRKNTHSGYGFSVTIREGKIIFEEEYDYYARGDDDGRCYVYGLVIPPEQFDAFLSLLIQRCGSDKAAPQTDKDTFVIDLLKQLAIQGQFTDYEAVKPRENLTIVHGWLEEAGIPHTPPYLAF